MPSVAKLLLVGFTLAASDPTPVSLDSKVRPHSSSRLNEAYGESNKLTKPEVTAIQLGNLPTQTNQAMKPASTPSITLPTPVSPIDEVTPTNDQQLNRFTGLGRITENDIFSIANKSFSQDTDVKEKVKQGLSLPRQSSLALPPHDESSNGSKSKSSDISNGRALATTIGSLAFVLAIFFVFVWLTRRNMYRASGMLPSDVIEVLGRVPFAGKQQLQLIQLGQKLILVSISAVGTTTLTEVTDLDEVNRLSGLCRKNQPGSATQNFREVFAQLNQHSSDSSLLEERNTNVEQYRNLTASPSNVALDRSVKENADV